MRSRKESAKTYHPKHTPEGSSFWPDGWNSECDILNVSVSVNGSQSHSEWDILDITETHSESEIRNVTGSHAECYCVTFWMWHSECDILNVTFRMWVCHWMGLSHILNGIFWISLRPILKVRIGMALCHIRNVIVSHSECFCVTENLHLSSAYGVALCCSVVQCGAVCCRVSQCVAVESAPQWRLRCCTVLQCGAVWYSVFQCVAVESAPPWHPAHDAPTVLQCVAVCCSVLQCVAVCCGTCHWSFGMRL